MKAVSETSKKPNKAVIQILGEYRKNVGSPNPYAVAEHVLGVKIDWRQSSQREVQHLLKLAPTKPFLKVLDAHLPHIRKKKTTRKIKQGTTTVKRNPRRKR